MTELTFRSNLTMEEIENNFAHIDFFSDLMDGLEEALAFSKNNLQKCLSGEARYPLTI